MPDDLIARRNKPDNEAPETPTDEPPPPVQNPLANERTLRYVVQDDDLYDGFDEEDDDEDPDDDGGDEEFDTI
jgi:hypothetical protein